LREDRFGALLLLPYLHADLTIKEKALALVTPPTVAPGRYKPPDALLAFLEDL
jgi:integrase/recombinase XerD